MDAVEAAVRERGRQRGWLPEHDGRGIVGGSADGTARNSKKRQRQQEKAMAKKAALLAHPAPDEASPSA